jgi:hypothetical protein
LTKTEEKDTITSTAQADPLIPEEFLSKQAEPPLIIQRDQVWTTNAIEERRGELNASSCEFAIAKGPMWEPASYVDVVISLKDGKGAPSLLAIRHQIINSTV